MLSLRQKTLSYQLLAAASQLDVKQSVVGVLTSNNNEGVSLPTGLNYLDLGVSEPAEAELDHGPVVEDLSDGVTVVDRVLQVGHQHQVPGGEPVVVDGLVVDVAEDGPGPQPVRVVLAVDVLAQPIYQVSAGLLAGLALAILFVDDLKSFCRDEREIR